MMRLNVSRFGIVYMFSCGVRAAPMDFGRTLRIPADGLESESEASVRGLLNSRLA